MLNTTDSTTDTMSPNAERIGTFAELERGFRQAMLETWIIRRNPPMLDFGDDVTIEDIAPSLAAAKLEEEMEAFPLGDFDPAYERDQLLLLEWLEA